MCCNRSVRVYYTQRKWQNTTKYETIHQTARAGKKKKKKKTELSEQSITSDGISFCHRCVHITKASINAAVCALWQTENFITASHQKRNIFQPRLQGEVNSKKSAQIRCALRTSYLTLQSILFLCLRTYFTLRLLALIDCFEMVEDTPIERWLETSHYIKIALSSTHLKTENHFT